MSTGRPRPPSRAVRHARSDQVSLARVSARMPVCSPRTAAAAAEGARPSTWPPSWVQARVRARIAVVLPAPAGAIASCIRAPGGAHLPDQRRLPGIECRAVRRHLQQRQIHCHLVDGRPVAPSGGGDEAPLGVEDPLRCVQVGAGDGVDRRPVGAPQGLRFLDAVSWCGQATDRRSSTSSTSRSTNAPPVRRVGRRCGPGVVLRRGRATSARSTGFPP